MPVWLVETVLDFHKMFETVSKLNKIVSYRPVSQDVLSEEEIPQDGMGTMTTSEERRMTIAKEMARPR